jgi:Na+-translocating ferredoxin:NAD+ oxidoreductase RnfC subunit
VQKTEPRVHPMKESRRVPQSMLRKRLKVEQYEAENPYDSAEMHPAAVRILLKQHAGVAAQPTVRAGDRVKAGQKIADMGPQDLGAPVHSSIDGVVRAVTETAIEIAS